MDFAEALDYLYSRLPVFQQVGSRAYKPGLLTTEVFCARLGNPQHRFRSIHVGGTNGKGSTSHMLAAVLQKAGYKTGLYTSPHLKSFTERIRINGQCADTDYIADFVTKHQSYIEEISPSFFEVTVAMALDYFAANQVDVAVIEVGMGGRLDSTNVIVPVVSVITNISFDHMQHLGNTLPEIAAEKAGIIKEGVPVVLSEWMGADVMQVFEQKAKEKNTTIRVGSSEWGIEELGQVNSLSEYLVYKSNSDKEIVFDNIALDLVGSYQKKNILGVLSTLEVLNEQSAGLAVEKSDIVQALRAVASSTGLKGRWQKLGEEPLVIADTAHNQAGLSYTIEQFLSIPAETRHFIIGFVADKDLSGVLGLFPKDAAYYFCQPSNPRALEASILAQEARKYGLRGEWFPDVNSALSEALSQATAADSIYVGGSTFVVSDLNNL